MSWIFECFGLGPSVAKDLSFGFPLESGLACDRLSPDCRPPCFRTLRSKPSQFSPSPRLKLQEHNREILTLYDEQVRAIRTGRFEVESGRGWQHFRAAGHRLGTRSSRSEESGSLLAKALRDHASLSLCGRTTSFGDNPRAHIRVPEQPSHDPTEVPGPLIGTRKSIHSDS